MTASAKKRVTLTAKYIVTSVVAALFLFPVFVMFLRAFTADDFVFAPRFFPVEWGISGFINAVDGGIVQLVANTLMVAGLTIAGTAISSTLCAYGFSKVKFKGQSVVFGIVIATLMLPAVCMQLQLFSQYYNWGWIGSWLPLIVPAFFGGGATNIFLVRQYMKGVPNSVCEAAKIDGANKFTIYWRIVLPMCMPIVTYVMVITFLGCWNDLMGPLMYLQMSGRESYYTLSLGIYMKSLDPEFWQWQFPNVQMAVGLLMMLPCVLLFFLFQKSLIEGVTMGSVKG